MFSARAEVEIRSYESDELIDAANIPAHAKPARTGGRYVVDISMKIFSAAAFEV